MLFHIKVTRPRVDGKTISQALKITINEGNRIITPTRMDDEVITFIIHQYSQPGNLVIDPTCGTGTVPAVATRLHRVGLGFDIVPNYLKIARYLAPNTQFILGDARNLAIVDGIAELVVFCPPLLRLKREGYPSNPAQIGNFGPLQVMEWTSNITQVLEECHRILKITGICVCLTVNMRTEENKLIPLTSASMAVAQGLGFSLVDEHIVYQQAKEWFEHLHVFQKI